MTPDYLPPEFAIPVAILAAIAYLVLEMRAQRRGGDS